MSIELFVDYSWVYYKSWHVFKNLSFPFEGQVYRTGAMYGVVRDISILRSKFPDTPINICIEPEDNSNRKMLNSAYKANRGRKEPTMFQLLNETLRALVLFPEVKVWSSEESGEADDVMFSLIKSKKDQLITGPVYALDNDLIQIAGVPGLEEKLCFAKVKDPAIPFEEYCQKKYDLEPKHFLIYRALVGDASDNLKKPVPRFPTKLARDLAIEMYENKRTLFESDNKYIQKLKEKWDVFNNNYQMMRLREIALQDLTEYFSSAERDVLYFVRRYGMKSMRTLMEDVT